ncbi:efflux transporter outer membrane subunit [Plasticicumulans acidivorans]|uniref:Multidrug efflux system outer membrane protein n=1 Tax=Plasticicumulans acidivorans TaxID=886464 RepID=A0A317MS45_9GAMM|nr:efflux transporter outer membrane subunit [Plasticicumulans acidivorans]PWV59287.1 multidrug efflux system outer membrane protein [Plasticicumulans acidivorans]
MRKGLWVACAVSLGGCSALGPDYERPPLEVPGHWRLDPAQTSELVNGAWWEQFGDPQLNTLIGIALDENRDLRIAVARVEEYLGRYGATRADQFPQVAAGADAGHGRTAESQRLPGSAATASQFDVNLGASFELDLWGRLRRATEAAQADLLAQQEARQTVVLTLVSSVANAYISLRELDQRLTITRTTLQSRAESMHLAQRRFEVGLTPELDARQAESEYESTRAMVPQLEQAIVQQENALSLLLGRNPGPIVRGRTLVELRRPVVPAGLPSDLIERRPDIRQAEQQLVAANAQIGIARAAYFPVVSLTGALGSVSPQLSSLFGGPARAWSYGAGLSVPVFTAGKIAGQVQAAEAVQQQTLENYRKTVQTAFAEVENALVAASKTSEQLEAQARQVEALRSYLRLARLRYDNGYTSYLEVLDAERNLFSAELSLAQTRGSELSTLVNLYKAMGGGWVDEAARRSTLVSPGVAGAPPSATATRGT